MHKMTPQEYSESLNLLLVSLIIPLIIIFVLPLYKSLLASLNEAKSYNKRIEYGMLLVAILTLVIHMCLSYLTQSFSTLCGLI